MDSVGLDDPGYDCMEFDKLIPPPSMLHDGSANIDEFIRGGPGFLHNSLIVRAGLRKEHAVLDIGSGNGKHARVLSEFLTTGRYVGFDIVKDTVTWCQDRYAHLSNFEFHHADVYSDWYNPTSSLQASDYEFPASDDSFDVAFAASLFTHLLPHETAQYLREAYRVLKPGGRLLLTCFLITPSNRFDRTRVSGGRFVSASHQHFVVDRAAPSRGVGYDETALRTMILEAGLRIMEVSFGRWTNGMDVLGAFQDCIVAIKPTASPA
jgi:SAM-dependent methyltransferase